MIKLLLYIKHHISFIWIFIEWINSFIFGIIYWKKIDSCINVLLLNDNIKYEYKRLSKEDMQLLAEFLSSQPKESFIFFKPHEFDLYSLKFKNRDKSFLMIGVFDGNKMIGYCFLRFFINKQAFRGKIVDKAYQGRGIAKQMGIITTIICKSLDFRLFATISKENVRSIASSKAVNNVRIVKELPNNYICVEYLSKM